MLQVDIRQYRCQDRSLGETVTSELPFPATFTVRGFNKEGTVLDQLHNTVPCRGNIPRPAGRGSQVAGDPRVESKTDMHILINQPAGAQVRTSSVYNVVTIFFTGFAYPKHIKTFTN